MSIARDIAAWISATASKKGPIKLATQAEVDAGTDSENAVTPDTLFGATPFKGMLIDVQIFKSSGTWTKPAGARLVEVSCLGGGGGGAGANCPSSGDWYLSSGGSGGGYVSALFMASGWGSTVPVVVGAGGAGGAAGANNGVNGGGSTFNGTSSPFASGGGGGKGNFGPANGVGAVATGGSGTSAGEVSGTEESASGGSSGGGNRTPNTSVSMSGGCGAGPFGAPVNPGRGTLSGTFALSGASGQNYGQAGTGAYIYKTVSSKGGGAGAPGYVMVRTYG